jgi:hypothetical protein
MLVVTIMSLIIVMVTKTKCKLERPEEEYVL